MPLSRSPRLPTLLRVCAAGPLLAGLVSLGACGRDPILDRAASLDAPSAAPAAAEEPAREPAPRELGGPAPGKPAPPAPGKAAEPGPGRPDAPQPGVPEEPRPGMALDGPSTVLSGTVVVAEGITGTVRIDAFDGDQRAAAQSGTPPKVVAQARLEAPGAFSLSVPQSAEKVWLGGYVDVDGNGRPDRDEPSGWLGANPVATAVARDDLRLELRVDPPPGAPE